MVFVLKSSIADFLAKIITKLSKSCYYEDNGNVWNYSWGVYKILTSAMNYPRAKYGTFSAVCYVLTTFIYLCFNIILKSK